MSHNRSIKCDISKLPDLDKSADICVFSQSLMGSNWKDYIKEAIRVLRHNGEILISESIDRYEVIKEYIDSLNLYMKWTDYKKTNRWFHLHILNSNKY